VTTDQLDGAKRSTRSPDFAFFLVVGLCLVVLAALYPVARAIDAHVDSKRPLYDDIAEVAWLEYVYYQAQGEAYPTEVSGGQSVTIGDTTYTMSPGVELTVTATDDGWCITGSDDLGNDAGEICYAGDVNPGNPF
jgi:hypothetical protein